MTKDDLGMVLPPLRDVAAIDKDNVITKDGEAFPRGATETNHFMGGGYVLVDMSESTPKKKRNKPSPSDK